MRAARIASPLDFGFASVISLPPRMGASSREDQVGNLFDLPLFAEIKPDRKGCVDRIALVVGGDDYARPLPRNG